MVAWGVGLSLVATLMALILAQVLTKPIADLVRAAKQVSKGFLDVEVKVDAHDEYRELGEAFNEMVANLRASRQALDRQVLENERLLMSLLPASGAAQVREGNAEARRSFADVTVAYINLLGFESMSPDLGEGDSMALLSDVVAACDEAAEHHGVEKVRTIGSSYLAVSGLSVERPDHTARMVEFAREVVRIVRRFNAERGVRLVAEIGINAGPVVGGLVGRRKFIYDLWGDTVKLARAIESNGEMSILVTRAVYERVRELVGFGPATRADVRGMGSDRVVLGAGRSGRMSELLNLVQGQWPVALGLVFGFPALLVVLNELGFALARAGHPVAASIRFVRAWVVPLVALVLFLRWVVLLPATNLWVRLTASMCWAAAIVAIIGVINNLVFEAAPQGSWQRKVPTLLRDLLRLLLVAIGLAMIYSIVWDREIEGALAALGVTSIVVGLALQEPLGNLFSGLMLLMERPFEVGETIEVGSVAGEVKEVNWRSAHIEALGGSIMVVPNSTLNKETIVNFSRPRPHRMELIDVGFSHQDPPYKVRQALTELARETEGVLQKPAPIAATLAYGDFSIRVPPDLPYRGKGPVAGQERVAHPHLVHGETPGVHNALSRAGCPAASSGEPLQHGSAPGFGSAGAVPPPPGDSDRGPCADPAADLRRGRAALR